MQSLAEKQDYILDETTCMVCQDLQITATQISNGAQRLKLSCVDICALQDQTFCLLKDDSNVYSISSTLTLTRLPHQGVRLTSSKTRLFLASEDGDLHVFRLTSSLVRESVISGLNKQPAILTRTFEGQSVTDLTYKHIEPETACNL